MPSLTRGQRRLLQYATRDGAAAGLKRRRVEDVAPALLQRKEKWSRTLATATASTDASPADVPLSAEVVEFLREHCPKAPRRLRQRQLRAIQDLSSAGCQSGETEAHEAFTIKRVELEGDVGAFAVMALAALQRRALWSGPTLHGASLLVLVETDADAAVLSAHMKKAYKIAHALVLDGSRFPTFPLFEKEDKTAAKTLSERTALVVASLQAFLTVDARSAIWKFVGAYVIWLKSSSKTPAPLRDMTDDARREFYERLCRQRWGCLGHVSVAAVIAPSRDSLFAAVADVLTTAVPAAEGAAQRSATATETVVGGADAGEREISASDGAKTGCEAGCADPVAALRRPVTVHYAVVEGAHRFQTLYTLLMSLRAGQGIVVHFATKEACQFLHDVLYALGELPTSVLLLTDCEGPSTYASVQDTEEDRGRLCAQFDKIISEAAHAAASTKDKKNRVVLLSAFGLVPQRGTIFVQYDVMVDIVNFAQFVSDVLTPAAYNFAAVEPTKRRRSRTPPPSRDRKASKGADAATAPQPSLPTKAMYESVLVFLRRNELPAALNFLQRPAKRLNVTFEPLSQLPSATRFLLSLQKMRSLHRKQFSVQNAAYAAYRATMLLYSLIGPAEVYNERRVELAKVAEEFGYTEVPVVDLRTRDTPFRPKEDIFRAAAEQAAVERRRMRAHARDHIVGEAPEEHIADDDVAEGEE
ncbi:uncharacterized protein Tco025E_02225 [Trypanosoma conorhini]|uniref:Uncharacterized protein n=1 Tax=Trypanosoma conorhini TaxID=83891 RepID=A0A3R7NQ61_9TRYP|nr:uncharacterized protein Tco025E_02225 [Trypanosoma conorhini]RNF25342.1 hypothetical protein Tco025E_02225 [Trypanosoma conorhini]